MSKKLTPYSAALRDIMDGYTYQVLYGVGVYAAAKTAGVHASVLLEPMRKSPEFKARQEELLKMDSV
jgi:GTP cyclohydrolase III